jgi:Bacteriophage probable baseplate hub protein
MPVSLVQEESNRGDFFVPQFEVRIEGVGLPRDVLRDVVQLTYKDSIKEIDSFELTVNNWDTTINDFKYIGAETAASLQEGKGFNALHRLFEPCRKQIEVRMGYVNNLRVMLTGDFSTMEPNFPNSGGSTLAVRGLNVLNQLRGTPYTNFWIDKKDSEIAENIATLRDPETNEKRFPLPIEIDKNAIDREIPREHVSEQNQYDIDFLLALARQRGYVVFVKEADKKKPKRLYFGPSTAEVAGLREVTFELQWGRALLDFKPTLTTANQVKSVTVRGWNRRTRSAIREKVTLDDRRIDINPDLLDLIKACKPRKEVVVREPVFTVRQAQQRALALLTERLKEMVKASVTTIGLPDLRAGQRVHIKGVGSRFNGVYFVTDTTHTINDSGYITRFNARREQVLPKNNA